MASPAPVHTVRFEPVGVVMEVSEGETVLDAAFRQGIALMHGCKEGQCGSCKARLISGDIELLKYSTFALPDYESATDHILLCRTHAYSDLTVELLNYDESLLSRAIAVKQFEARVVGVSVLTHDIRRLDIELDLPLTFWAGQYVDLSIPDSGITRAYSMASSPRNRQNLHFIIKKYPDGQFSSRLDGGMAAGDRLLVKGPYGSCFRREGQTGPMLLIGGGSGMSPLWSILNDHFESGETRPVRFFYGARTRADLLLVPELATIATNYSDFEFVPVLSQADEDDTWDGERGLVHEAVERFLARAPVDGPVDTYSCGPPPMVDAVLRVLRMAGVEPERLYFDKFTQPQSNVSARH